MYGDKGYASDTKKLLAKAAEKGGKNLHSSERSTILPNPCEAASRVANFMKLVIIGLVTGLAP